MRFAFSAGMQVWRDPISPRHSQPRTARFEGTVRSPTDRPELLLITAYNYPMFLAATKIGAALAAGCTVSASASPQAPLSTLLIGEIATKVGFLLGVLNVIVGGPEVGRRVTENPAVAVVSFTGSVAVGKAVMQQASHHVANVVLELGGKSPAIVLPGADLKAIVKPLHQRYARNAGQGCASPTRLLIPAQDFTDFFTPRSWRSRIYGGGLLGIERRSSGP